MNKSAVIAKTITASNLTDADLINLFKATTAKVQTADVKNVLAGVVTVLVQRGLVTLPA